MSPSQPARPLYLNGETDGVFALFNDAPHRRGKTAVLVCPAFGWDPICPYRKRRDWAERRASDGYATLQIELPGSGNSAGNPNDPARLLVWTQAVSAAARWLRATTGAERIVALGVGMGGLVSYRAAFEQAPIDDFVLWAVPARGRALVRELRVYSRLAVSRVLAPGDTGPPLLPEGAVLAVGYVLSAETAAALEAIDLTELPLPNAKHRRVLLLGRNGLAVDELLRGSLERAGVEVTVASGRGRGAINKVFERVDSWLAEGETHRDWASAAVEAPGPSGTLSARDAEPSSQKHLRLSCAGVALRETPVWVDRPSGRLCGVLTEPLDAQARLCAVLLNAGPQRHAGPSRMWVEIARRWAARDVPTLRIDPSWIGEDEDTSTDVGARSVPDYVDETCAVLKMLTARGLPSRFVLLGLSAGAYWSMRAALRDEQIAAIIMLNPRAQGLSAEQAEAARATTSLRRRLLHSLTLRKVLSGEIAPGRFVEVSRLLAALAARTSLDRSRRIAGSWRGDKNRPHSWDALLDALRDRGQRALLVFTGTEPLQEELEATGTFDRLDRWPNLELLTIGTSTPTHMLTPLWLQQEVHRLVDGVLDRELERAPKRAISTST
jgi:alpha-beta hydrolase superfamily lysophospholipase